MLKITDPDVNQTSNAPRFMIFILLAGVILPAITLGVEMATRLCAKDLFDPIPTWWHVLFVAFVPVTNLQIWLALKTGRTERLSWLSFANSAAIAISLFYTIIFAPLMPFAVIGIAFFLIGLLPLSPAFSLIAGILLRRNLRRLLPETKPFMLGWKGLITACVLVFTAVGLAELPFTLTKIGVIKASAETIAERDEGLNFLRKFGDEDYLLRLCYRNSNVVITDFVLSFLETGNASGAQNDESVTEQSKKAFYRLTGKDFRSVPAPRGIKNWERLDAQQYVGGMILNDGLTLNGSQLDGSVDGDAAVGYLEWTLTFKNEKSWQQEAISQIALPPGAVVSRLALWINGEEREAAFAKSAKVAEAYNAVTSQWRDPALLTVSGKDRVSLKCFPVPSGGEMKVRIGITAPLILEKETESVLKLPHFQDRNFAIATEHAVWVESKKPLEIAAAKFSIEQHENISAVRGSLTDDELVKIGAPVKVGKSADVKISWTKNKADENLVIKQEIREKVLPKTGKIVFVVDASAAMKDFQAEVAETIENLPAEIKMTLVLTGGNGFNGEIAAPNSFTAKPAEIAEKIRSAIFAGGTDSVPAIETAWELANAAPEGVIVRLHAPQTVELTPPNNLRQFWSRRPDSAPVYSLQVRPGKDAVERILNSAGASENIPRFDTVSKDLADFVAEIGGRGKAFEAVRTAVKAEDFKPDAGAKETSQHLARLWASDEVARLLQHKSEAEAIDLAVKNQLVTPVSGAVVLENQQQYDQFGLKPVEANTVPTIPEPEEYLLFAVVLAVLIWFFRRFRQKGFQTV